MSGSEATVTKRAERLELLRRRAQEVLAASRFEEISADGRLDPLQLAKLMEELRTYQVELELQNEELYAAQLEADAARRRYQHLFTQMPLAAMVLDEQGKVDDCNGRADELLGPRSLRGPGDGRFLTRLEPEDRQRVHRALRELAPGETQLVESLRLGSGVATAAVFDAHLIGLSIDYKLDRRTLALLVDKTSEIARQQDQQFYMAMLDSSDSFIYAADDRGQMLLANRALLESLDCTRDQVVGHPRNDFLPLRDAILHLEADQKVLQTGHALTVEEQVHRPASRGTSTYLTRKFPLRDLNGRTYGVAGISTDITAIKDQQRHAMLSETVFMSSSDGIIITDADTYIVRVNPAFTRQTGFSPESLQGRKTSILKSGRQDSAFYSALWHSLTTTGSWCGELCNRRADGTYYTVWSVINAVADAHGQVVHYVAIQTDVTQLHNVRLALAHQAHYDNLTGLPNRALLTDRLKQLVASALRHGKTFAVLFLDLDRFKEVNDTLGHLIGDRLLREVAQRLQERVRTEDTVARIGGDEFVVLLPETDEAGALATAARILERVHVDVFLSDHVPYRPMASLGLAVYPRDGKTPDLLLRSADLAMYAAKTDGHNRIRAYSQEMGHANDELFALQNELNLAIERQQLRLHYQPKCRLADQALVGAEALVRWQRPGNGLVLPGHFIGVAERCGLLVQLDRWVVHEALRQLGQWIAEGQWQDGWRLSINQSVLDLKRPEMVFALQDLLLHYGVSASMLELEITEDALYNHTPELIKQLEQLIAMGVTVAIDDFGTGYSSLAYLRQLPISVIKIDRGFVSGMLVAESDAVLVQTIIDMAHNLGHKVVAEGVELPAQRELLQRMGAEVGQGFLFGKAMDAQQFADAWLPVAARPSGEYRGPLN